MFKKNVAWNLLGNGVPMLVGLISIPSIISGIGVEAFGVLTLIWTTIGYFSLFDLGMGRALTLQVAQNRSQSIFCVNHDVINGLVSIFLLGFVGAFIMHVVSIYYVENYLVSSTLKTAELKKAFFIASYSLPLVTLFSGVKGVLEGFEEFYLSSWIRGILGALNFGAPMLMVFWGYKDLTSIVWVLVFSRFIVVLFALYKMYKKYVLEYFGFQLDLKSLKKLLKFGSWMTLSNLVGPLMVMMDRFLVANISGTNNIAFYTVPQDFVIRLLIIPAAISTALFPRFTLLNAGNLDVKSEYNDFYRKGIFLNTVLMGSACFILFVFAQPLLTIWIDEKFALQATQVSRILILGVFLNSIAHIPLASLQSKGGVKITALLHCLELILYIPLLWYFVREWGVEGAAITWTLRTGFDLILLIIFDYKKNVIK